MLKMVLGDYKTMLNFRAIKKQIKDGAGFFYLYILMLAPSFTEVNGGVFYFAFFVPAIFGMFFSYACPNRLPKLFYLCPMDEKERREYLKIGYQIRCGVPILLYFIIAAILWSFKMINGIDLLVGLLHIVLLCLVSNLYGGKKTLKTIDYGLKKRNVIEISGWQIYSQIFLLCSFFFYYAIYEGIWKHGSIPMIFIVLYKIWFVVTIVPSSFYILKNYSRVMQESLYYENVKVFDQSVDNKK